MPQSPWPPAFGMQRYSPWGHPPGDGYISHQTGSLENHLQICNFFGGYVSLLVPWRVPLWISIVGRWNFLLGKALGYVSFQGGCSHWIVYIWIVFQLVRTIAVGLQVSNVLFQGSFFSLRLHGCNYSGWIWSDLIVTTKKKTTKKVVSLVWNVPQKSNQNAIYSSWLNFFCFTQFHPTNKTHHVNDEDIVSHHLTTTSLFPYKDMGLW